MTDSHNPKTTRNKAIITAITTGAMTPTQAANTSTSHAHKPTNSYANTNNTAPPPSPHNQPAPHTYPTKTPDTTLQLIIATHHTLKKQGHYAGARSIRQHLLQAAHQPPHESTIQRKLKQAGLTKQEPKKRPRTSWNCFEADLPNELWQSDFTPTPRR